MNVETFTHSQQQQQQQAPNAHKQGNSQIDL